MKTKFFTFFLAIMASIGTIVAEDLLFIDFTSGQGDWIIENKVLDGVESVWAQDSRYGMVATAYADSANHEAESWLISPTINLSNVSVATLAFSHARRYGYLSQLSVRATSNGIDWTILEVSDWPSGSNWNFITAVVDLSAFVGYSNVQIAFVYTSSSNAGATWEIKTVNISPAATGKFQIGDFCYYLNGFNRTAIVDQYIPVENNRDVIIPDSVEYKYTTYSVISIGNRAFHGCSDLTNVIIPNSVISIGYGAFDGCSGLTNVIIPNSVISMGGGVFSGCSSLSSVTIGNSVTSIDNSIFSSCASLTSVIWNAKNCQTPSSLSSAPFYSIRTQITSFTFGNDVKSIPAALCYGMQNLTSITIPDGVTSIGSSAFSSCSGLSAVIIGNSVTNIGHSAFDYCSSLTSVIWNAKNCQAPTEYYLAPFYSIRTQITSFTFGNDVKSIPAYLCRNMINLNSITIPYSVVNIGKYAFDACRSLVVTCLSEIPPILGYCAFYSDVSDRDSLSIYVPCGTLDTYKSKWTNYESRIMYEPLPYSIMVTINNPDMGLINIPRNICDSPLTALPNYGYHFVQWSDGNTDNPRLIELTQDTTFIAEFAIDVKGVCGDDNLLTWTFDSIAKALTISGEGKLNSNYTFGLQAPTQTEKLFIVNGVTCVGDSAFINMSTIDSIVFPWSVSSVGNYAFAGIDNRKFNTLILPSDIISIGEHAFEGAQYLQTIDFGSSLEEIGAYAFYNCTRVKQMTCLAEITPNVGTMALTSISSLAELYVQEEHMFDYQIDPNWSRFQLKAYEAPTSTEDANVNTRTSKFLNNGQIFILRGDKTYTTIGQLVR